MINEYRIKSTGEGQARYGSCERCGKHCSETFMQQLRKPSAVGWVSSGFGHLQCLKTNNWVNAPVVHKARPS